MRGFPPLHVLAFAVAFALLAIPLYHLTSAQLNEAPAAPVNMDGKSVEKLPAFIRVRMAHQPSSLSLTLDGVELLSPEQQKPGELEISLETPLAISPDGVEIFAKAAWPEGTPATALTIDLEAGDKEPRTQTNWSAGKELKAAYVFQWKP